MKLLHTGDLHLGKRLHGYSLLEDQHHMLLQLKAHAITQAVDAVLLAGDIYDRTVPSAAAVTLLDDFLTALLQEGIAVLLIAGNHDSPERLQFGSRLLAQSGLHIAAVYEGEPKRVTLRDKWGPVHFGLLPYAPYQEARAYFPELEIKTQRQAVEAALRGFASVGGERSVLLAHQYVAGYEAGEEQVGGLDAVPASLFECFSYVALGHIHKRYPVAGKRVHYAGSPLKYAFDDALQEKGALLVTLDGAGGAEVEFLPVAPLHDVRRIRGPIKELLAAADGGDALVHAILTDRENIVDAMRYLRAAYPNILHLSYENGRAQSLPDLPAGEGEVGMDERFRTFFRLQNGEAADETIMTLFLDALAELEREEGA